MPTSECFVCQTCGKHTEMLGSRYSTENYNSGDLIRLPLGWYAQRVTPEVDIQQFQVFCSELCVNNR